MSQIESYESSNDAGRTAAIGAWVRGLRVLMMVASVAFKPSALSYSDLFQLRAAARYPRSSRPFTSWIIRESLFITVFGGLFCTFVGYVASPTLSPLRLALRVVPLLLFAWSLWLVISTWWAYRAYRSANVLIVELSEDGISFRDPDSEWRTRWKPAFQFEVTTRFVIISCGGNARVGIPRESFASFDAEDQFVRMGRLLQDTATNLARLEMKGDTLEGA